MAVETNREPAARLAAAGTEGFVVDWLAALGLAADPFADPPFFDGAGRRQLLEQVLHQCQFSASALVVSGETGAGKSALKLELLSHLGADDDVCCIDVPTVYDPKQLLAEVVRGFGLSAADGAGRGQLLSEIRHFGQTGEEGALALLVLDDAHHLDDQLLAALLSLLQGQDDSVRPLHLILFGDPSLALRLDAVGIVDVLIHDVSVEPFSGDEAAQYLSFCLEQAGYSGEPLFAEPVIDRLWRESQGLPGQLNPLARQYLIEAATPEPAARRRSPLLPFGHMLAVAGLGAILIVALLYSGDEPELALNEPVPAIAAADGPTRPQAAATPVQSPPLQSPRQNTDAAPRDFMEALAPVVSDVARLPAPAAGAEPGPSPPTPKPDQPVAAARAVRPAALPTDEARLLALEKTAFTLQVLAAGSEDSVRRFVERQADPGQLQVFTTRRRGKDWYVVVHGSFPDAASARRAIAALPPALREAGPWPRSIASVQADIEGYRGN